MLDTYVRVSPEVTVHSTITEKRAPTDDSIRLLKEMQEKAQASVISAVSLTDNTFNCVIHTQKDLLSCMHVFLVIYSLNGKRRELRVEADEWMSPEEKIEKVIESLSTRLACDILRNTLPKVMHETHM